MAEYIYLVGAEDVQRAASSMSSSADVMRMAASSIEDSLFRHRQFLDEFIGRFEEALKNVQPKEG